MEKTKKEPLFHIIRRANPTSLRTWVARSTAIVVAFLFCAILAKFLIGANPLVFIKTMFVGAFGGSIRIWNFIKDTAILLGIALALVPAFKMHFWNTGAEGQVLISMLGSVACIVTFGGKIPEILLLVVMLVSSLLAGMIWAVIPAVCKAFWNTNETLFTLMMNYLASFFVRYCLIKWTPSGSSALGRLKFGFLPTILHEFFLSALIIAVVTVVIQIYLKRSKHGYELEVVGESINTAKYVGINVKKVIIRTMALSGLLCGLVGYLMVAGINHSVTADSVGGRGFTAIMVAWMANFSPYLMIFTSGLVSLLDLGASEVQTQFKVTSAFPSVVVGIVLFFVIGCEFFINYQIVFRKKEVK